MASAAVLSFVGAIVLARMPGQSEDFAVFAGDALQDATAKPAVTRVADICAQLILLLVKQETKLRALSWHVVHSITKSKAFMSTSSVNNDVCSMYLVYFDDMPVQLKKMLCLTCLISVSQLLKPQC